MGKAKIKRAGKTGGELGGEGMETIYRFAKGKEEITLSGEQIKEAGEIAVKAVLTYLPEEQRTYFIVKCILDTACDLLGEKEIKL